MGELRDRYELLLEAVSKPGRYLGNERGAVRKDPGAVPLRFALAFPEVYEIAQSHPGLQILYDLLNRRSDTYAERAYAPWMDMEQALRQAGLPLASLETFTPLREFDIVGFSLQYELTYTNILLMLDLGGIPLLAEERDADAPLVIVGGPCAFNPEPLADFVDAVLLGDGEEAIHEICDVYLGWDRRDRETLLAALAEIPGIYVPRFFAPEYDAGGRLRAIRPLRGRERVEKRILRDLNSVPTQQTYVLPTAQIVHDRPSLEVMRGCVKGCRFCQAGYIYRPQRDKDPQKVIQQAEEVIRQTGYEELSLLSLSTGDYSCVNPVLTEIMNRFAARKVAVSLPSTRVDALATPLLEQIKRVRKTGFTLAPEAGTQRMRDIIQKEYTEDELINAARQLFSLGWRTLKLYFMLGLPSETEEDLLGIADLSARVAAVGGNRRQVTASVSNFVPKPHTPFQWASQIPTEEVEARQRFLRRELGRRGLKFKWHDARETLLEGIFSRGDRRLGRLLLDAYRRGCRFDGWSEYLRLDLWQQAWESCGIDPSFYLRRRRLDEVLPWDHLSSGVTKKFFQRELARAFERTLTPDCSTERCTYCGACDFTEIRNVTYHLKGAKGAEHRGTQIDSWARQTVPGESEGAWEPRGWHLAQAKQMSGGTEASRADGGSLRGTPRSRNKGRADIAAATLSGEKVKPISRADGTAEAWINAAPSSLTPAVDPTKLAQRMRVRFSYAKLGPARFVGMLELGTVLARALRRADLPVAFSQGHHPLPRVAFGPALPVGVQSDCEYLDIAFTEALSAADAAARLDAEMPEGVRILDAIELPPRTPSIDASITAFRYEVGLGEAANARHVERRIAAFLEQTDFPLHKRNRNGERVINARPFVVTMQLTRPSIVETVIQYGSSGTIKPADLFAALLEGVSGIDPPFRIRKTETLFRREGAASTAGATAVVA